MISVAIEGLHGQTVTVVVRETGGQAAAWMPEVIERTRKPYPEHAGRIVIGVDPGNRDGDERGIIAAELADDGDYYVLADCSGTGCITSVMNQVVETYRQAGADLVVGVDSLAGHYLEDFLHLEDPGLRYRRVHWMRGYADRVTPLIALYGEGRVHHVREFPELEKQMCERGGARVNALVAAIIELRSTA